jgi:hypothetical protein
MKKLFLLAALVANAQAESQMYAVTESCSSEFKTSYGFVEIDLGARFGRAKPYLQSFASNPQVLSQSVIPGQTSLSGLPGISKGFSGFVGTIGLGGDYIFKSSCFVLGGYLKYAFSRATAKYPVTFMQNLAPGRIDFSTPNFGLKFHSHGYLSFGTRMGVRCNRHLWVGILGMSFPAFTGSMWSMQNVAPNSPNSSAFGQKIVHFKSKVFPFLQFGGEYSYSVTRNFSMGLSYIFNMGRVRLSKVKVTGTGSNINVANALISSNTVYRSKRANFSEIVAIFRYMMPTSR